MAERPALRRLLVVTAGALIGGFAGWWTYGVVMVPLPREPAPQAAVDRLESAADARSPVQACDDLGDRERTLSAEVAELEALRTLMRGQLALVGGVPEVWPDGVDPAAEEARHREDWERAVAVFGDAELVEVDCAEPPCLAVVEVWGRDGIEDGAIVSDLGYRIAEAGGLEAPGSRYAATAETDRGWVNLVVVDLGDAGPSDTPGGKRLQVRRERLVEAARAGLAPGRGAP
jgi:hypothetical protein